MTQKCHTETAAANPIIRAAALPDGDSFIVLCRLPHSFSEALVACNMD